MKGTLFRSFFNLLCSVLFLFSAASLLGQFTYVETFQDKTTEQWILGTEQGGFTPVLTADAGIDSDGDGWLRLAWTAGKVLTINNWDGIFNDGGGNDQIIFGSTLGGLASQVGQIYFLNPGGIQGFFSAQILANGEIIPVMVPETSTLFGGFMILGVAGAHIWQRRRQLHTNNCPQ